MPGSPVTFAGIWDQLGKALKPINEAEKFGSANTPNLLDMENSLQTSIDGEFTSIGLNAVRNMRNALSAQISDTQVRALWTPYLQEMQRVIGTEVNTTGDATSILAQIRDYMAGTASQTIKSRVMVSPQPAKDLSNTGDGSIHRVTVDFNGDTIEAQGAELMRADIVRDQNQAQEWAEVFRFRGRPRERDNLYWNGSGIVTDVPCLHAKTSSLLLNPSFDSNDATNDGDAPASLTGITNWAIGSSAASFALRTGAGLTFRGHPGAPDTIWGAEFLGNDTLTQVFQQEQPGTVFSDNVPYYAQVAWNRQSSGDGTLRLYLGTQFANATVSGGTNGQWNILRIPLGVANWYDSFKQADLALKLELFSRTTGSVIVDDVCVAPMVNVGGHWYMPVGGGALPATAPTAFLLDDFFTWTTTEAVSRGILAYWLWRAFGIDGWLPTATPGLETIADPT